MDTFTIPLETNLEELTPAWTLVNTKKQYQCKNKVDGVHTMFWESDRSQSTFELQCQSDGSYRWEEWPVCLTGIITFSQHDPHFSLKT